MATHKCVAAFMEHCELAGFDGAHLCPFTGKSNGPAVIATEAKASLSIIEAKGPGVQAVIVHHRSSVKSYVFKLFVDHEDNFTLSSIESQ
jgi:hypothetical protein